MFEDDGIHASKPVHVMVDGVEVYPIPGTRTYRIPMKSFPHWLDAPEEYDDITVKEETSVTR